MLTKIDTITKEQLAGICDHTFLARAEGFPKTSPEESPVKLRDAAFQKFLEESARLKPYAVCVRPEDVQKAVAYLKGIRVASVVGFPYGYSTDFKVAETKLAVAHGALEIDMVLDYDKFKQGDLNYVKGDIKAVVKAAKKALVKLILETSELSNEQIKLACQIAKECKVHFVKTSTGFTNAGAKAEHLKIMRENFDKGVKMSGGVKPDNVKDLLKAVSGRDDGMIDLDPMKVRIGESSLLAKL